MKKIIFCLSTVFVFLFIFSSCGYKYDGVSLLGVWRIDGDGEENYTLYDFYSNEKVKMTRYNYGIAYAEVDCYYEVSDKGEIMISSENGDTEINKFKIKKGVLTIDTGKSKIKLNKYESEYNKDESIYGEWKDPETEDRYVFGDDYEGIAYNKDNEAMYFGYSTKGDILYFESFFDSSRILPITYRIEDDTLYFEYDGETYAKLKRVIKDETF